MSKVTAMPSSGYWTENDEWYAYIQIHLDDAQITIERTFETEEQASTWRNTMMECLRDFSVEVKA